MRRMRFSEAIDRFLGTEGMVRFSPRLRPLFRCVGLVGIAGFVLASLFFLRIGIQRLAEDPSDVGSWGVAGLAVLFLISTVLRPLWTGFRAIVRAGRERPPCSIEVPDEGMVLKRMHSRVVPFLGAWCLGWNAMVVLFLRTVAEPEKQVFPTDMSVVVVFLLAGVVVAVRWIRQIILRRLPTYEVRLLGGRIRGNGTISFFYRFSGDSATVKSVEWSLAIEGPGFASGGSVTDELGTAVDGEIFDSPGELAAGRHVFEMPEIDPATADELRYYLRAVVVFSNGLTAASTYRIPFPKNTKTDNS